MHTELFGHTRAEVARFSLPQSDVTEYHIMIHVTDKRLSFSEQFKALDTTLTQLAENELRGAEMVFKRYFLSDAYNQADEVIALELDYHDYALSVIQQPPLDGSKVALWAYMQTSVETRALPSGLFEVRHGSYRHLWNGSARNLAKNAEYQTRLLLNEYIMQLAKEGCKLADNCIRTWFYVNDVDNNYTGMVKARNTVFFTQNLSSDTHFIASTGIEGRQANARVLVQMDNYAIDGISPQQIRYLYAADYLNRTSDYGVSFERGTCVDYGDRSHVFISGTASINNKGEVIHQGDITAQVRQVWDNVEALLCEAGCTYANVMQMIVYLRDMADYEAVRSLYDERFMNTPRVIVLAPVCRPGWLIEMECIAIRPGNQPAFPVY